MGTGEVVTAEPTVWTWFLDSEDMDMVRPLAETCFAEFKYPGSFAWEHFLKFWQDVTDSSKGGVLGVFEKENEHWKLRGILGLMLGVDQFSADKVCLVNWWFVMPEHRNHKFGGRLLYNAESFARFEQCKRILMGSPFGFEKFFAAHGFSPIETGYHKVL